MINDLVRHKLRQQTTDAAGGDRIRLYFEVTVPVTSHPMIRRPIVAACRSQLSWLVDCWPKSRYHHMDQLNPGGFRGGIITLVTESGNSISQTSLGGDGRNQRAVDRVGD